MPRARNPNRDAAFKLWKESDRKISNRAIAEKLGEPEKTISVWKLRDKWNEALQSNECSTAKSKRSTTKRRGAPKGNKNAVGHESSTPIGNQNAVVTGEFTTLMFSTFTDEQKAVAMDAFQSDELTKITQQIALAQAREKIQLERIDKYTQTKQGMLLQSVTSSEKGGIRKTLARVDDHIHRCEEALTRVQDLIRKLVADKHRIEYDNAKLEIERRATEPFSHENSVDDGFIEAISAGNAEVWGGEDADETNL